MNLLSRKKELVLRLTEVFLNGKWIAHTNFKDQITQVSWEEAIEKMGPFNTIAQLTFHVNYYIQGLLKYFQIGVLDIKDKYSFEMPYIKSSEDWQNLVETFLHNAENLISEVDNMDDASLDQIFVKEEYGSFQRNIEAQVEHAYYHLGQISLLRKMQHQQGS